MRIVKINITVDEPFGNLFRKRCVLIAAANSKNKILLGNKKNFFPPKIARLLGGGVDEGENLLAAASRELFEEINIKVPRKNLKEIIKFEINAIDKRGRKYCNITHLYYANIGDKNHHSSDEVDSVVLLGIKDIEELAETYFTLPKTLWYKGEEGEFCWYDYGQVYGVIHKELAKQLRRGYG